jgi:hypothetical protein
MSPVRLAASAVVVVSLSVCIAAFFASALSQASSGAGLAEAHRSIGFLAMAVFAVVGWILGTSAIFSIFVNPKRLPAPVRRLAVIIVFGPHRGASRVGENLDEPVVVGNTSRVSVRRLLGLAFIELPLFLFLAPLLLGWLLQPVVYRPPETAAVGTMAVVLVTWTVFLAVRAARWYRVSARERGRPA